MNAPIKIEPLNQRHAPELFALTERNRDHLRKWLPWPDSVTSVVDTEVFIRSAEEQTATGNGPNFAVFYEGSICGVAGFHQIDRKNRIGAIGYWLGEAYQGKGIISTVVKKLLDIGFSEHHLNKIEIRCAERNLPSRAIPERLGFTYEGTLRQDQWLYSRFVDLAVYSMLASEYHYPGGTARQPSSPQDI